MRRTPATVKSHIDVRSESPNGGLLHSLRWKSLVLKCSLFIALCVVSGLLAAHFGLFNRFMSKQPVNTGTVSKPKSQKVPTENIDLPVQTNPLFTSRPSWYQDYSRESGGPDPSYWNVLLGPAENGNNEQQYYSAAAKNLNIENGSLRLIATKDQTSSGIEYRSARIETEGKKEFRYGRFDITAKLPVGVGTWPAVWLLPANDTYSRISPQSDTLSYRNGGEIDILEAVGFMPDVVYGVAHTLSDLSEHPDGTGSYGTVSVPGSSQNFNKYTLLWTPVSIEFLVNDRSYATYLRKAGADYRTWPFDQPFYLIVNLAMGGSWGGMDTVHFPGNGIDNSALPTSLDIRSIYYYPYAEQQAH